MYRERRSLWWQPLFAQLVAGRLLQPLTRAFRLLVISSAEPTKERTGQQRGAAPHCDGLVECAGYATQVLRGFSELYKVLVLTVELGRHFGVSRCGSLSVPPM